MTPNQPTTFSYRVQPTLWWHRTFSTSFWTRGGGGSRIFVVSRFFLRPRGSETCIWTGRTGMPSSWSSSGWHQWQRRACRLRVWRAILFLGSYSHVHMQASSLLPLFFTQNICSHYAIPSIVAIAHHGIPVSNSGGMTFTGCSTHHLPAPFFEVQFRMP